MRIALIGRPNAGKSTLLNAFLGEQRAIVTAEPGTTRDVIEGVTYWHGEPVRIVDTAGLRHGSGVVEKEGIARARAAAADADLLLAVVDASRRWDAEDALVVELVRDRPGMVVLNKIDLPRHCNLPKRYRDSPVAEVSAQLGRGLDQLRDRASALLPRPNLVDGIGITRDRHRERLSTVVAAAEGACRLIREREPEELIAVELQAGLVALGDML